MKKSKSLSYYTLDATTLLGRLVREARKERRMTMQELAERAGISMGLLQRIEKGEPGCAIGSVFEVATLVGIRLFDADRPRLDELLRHSNEKLALLPKSVRERPRQVYSDF